jgi:hypothetical protein
MARAQFTVPFGKQIKATVDRVAGIASRGIGRQRQFETKPGQFRLAKVIAEGTGLAAAACEVDVYGIRFLVADFPETLGAQTLGSEELSGTETFAAAGIDEYIQLGDYVGVISWNARHWIVKRFANCPESSGSGEIACLTYELTLSGYGGNGAPLNGDHILTKTLDSGTVKVFTKEFTDGGNDFVIQFGLNAGAAGHTLTTQRDLVQYGGYTQSNAFPGFSPFCTECHLLELVSTHPDSGLAIPNLVDVCPPGVSP